MKFIVEHMEQDISEWVMIEYKNMAAKIGPESLIFSSLDQKLHSTLTETIPLVTVSDKSVLDLGIDMKRILLLDPSAPEMLQPEDGEKFDYLLFGGILGDDPPQDRTGILRRMGFATRHLGKFQMTTDTAVIVSHKIASGCKMEELDFVDTPEIKIAKKEFMQLPFRFLVKDGKPQLAPGLIQLLHKQNGDSFE